MEENIDASYHIMKVCLLAGRIMLQSGAETYRVEDTMTRMASALGSPESHSYVTPTGIIFSVEGDAPAKFIRISERSTDLTKVVAVNQISRRMVTGEISPTEAYDELKEVQMSSHAYPKWLQIFVAAVASGCFLIMFLGEWHDFMPAFIAGGLGFTAMIYFHRLVQIKFFAEFLASLIIGLLSSMMVALGIGHQLDKIIIGSVMPLVPGVLITNAIRDLMAGHLVSGLSKGAEAFLTAFAIGAGVAVVFALRI